MVTLKSYELVPRHRDETAAQHGGAVVVERPAS